MNTPQNLEPHQVRMVEEHTQLSDRLSKLRDFFGNPMFLQLSEVEQARLKAQEMFMAGYESVLGDRLNAILQQNLP